MALADEDEEALNRVWGGLPSDRSEPDSDAEDDVWPRFQALAGWTLPSVNGNLFDVGAVDEDGV